MSIKLRRGQQETPNTKLDVLSVTFLYFSKTSLTVPPNRTVFLGGELKKSFSNSSTSEILYNQDYQAIKCMTENYKNHTNIYRTIINQLDNC